ncbi:Rieske (2Fe-2S) protein [Natrarchaeobius oligotrophus]|uniref:Rieske (2Fe-2S) protein n=1 Tax=Natrarchaeobius chitinivorans TaxID=1679083 RepID=A0A3N6MWL8_NATCH|nr:Rieske (2Fe-2S) protein [Natrarchaeobius chitinivorans]RQH02371.1 Rieske (2Fe-2S) protein [Natrarchaeobius chitinivorans]
MSRTHVGSVDEFEHGDRTLTSVDGTSVGVFCVDDEFYALENECPHQGGPACSGRIGGEIVAEIPEPGKRKEERISDNLVVACPWHGWEFEIETGIHLGDDSICLEKFEVVVEDGEVYVTS